MKDQTHKKHKDLMADLRSAKDDELKARFSEFSEQQFWGSYKHRAGQNENSANLRKNRRMVARLKTVLSEKKPTSKGAR